MSAAGKVKRTSRRVDKKAKKAAGAPWLQRATRLGYVMRGLLYGAVGVLAIRTAFGWHGDAQDLRGALVLVPGGPVRPVLLAMLVIGLFAYGLWGFIRAIWDPLNRGSDMPGYAARMGFVWSGFNYIVLSIYSLAFLVGAASSDGSDSMYRLVNGVMSHSGGWIVLTIAGIIGVGAGLGQFADAVRAPFRKDLKRNKMPWLARVVVDNLGRFGMAARGVVFTLLGWFILQAGASHDAHRTENMRQVFSSVGSAPLGHLLLTAVGLGFVALAVHSVALAQWVRMPQPAD